jgi:hypothetical protein
VTEDHENRRNFYEDTELEGEKLSLSADQSAAAALPVGTKEIDPVRNR